MRATLTWPLLFSLAAVALGCGDSSSSDNLPTPNTDAGKDTGGSAGSANDASVDAPADTTADSSGDDAAKDALPADSDPGDSAKDAPPDTKPHAGCIQGNFKPYYGNLHAHTSNSDGEQKPEDAFAYARDQGKLDIMVVTDHLEQVMIPPRWANCKSQADAANAPGSFVAACGYEYATFSTPPMSTGHNNIFFDDALMKPTDWNYKDVYNSVVACPNCIGQFNHPGSEVNQTWNNFEYDPAADNKMNLFEFSGEGPVWDLFFVALNKGWHVSPMHNQDNHSADWGTKDNRRSGFFMTNLDRVSLWDAMKNRRSFMSHDKNASIRMVTDQSCWMGSILSGYTSAELSVEVLDADPTDGFTTIEFFGPAKKVIGSVDCQSKTSCNGKLVVDATSTAFVVARASQTDGDQLVSAPIWFVP